MRMKTVLTLLFAAAWCLALAAAEPFVWRTRVAEQSLEVELAVAPGAYVYADTLSIQLSGRNGEVLTLLDAPVPDVRMHHRAGVTIQSSFSLEQIQLITLSISQQITAYASYHRARQTSSLTMQA